MQSSKKLITQIQVSYSLSLSRGDNSGSINNGYNSKCDDRSVGDNNYIMIHLIKKWGIFVAVV